MKILNRPMFRYGGPIKEGIMDGIREPKKQGGSMGAALVGNPAYPRTNGREHHQTVEQNANAFKIYTDEDFKVRDKFRKMDDKDFITNESIKDQFNKKNYINNQDVIPSSANDGLTDYTTDIISNKAYDKRNQIMSSPEAEKAYLKNFAIDSGMKEKMLEQQKNLKTFDPERYESIYKTQDLKAKEILPKIDDKPLPEVGELEGEGEKREKSVKSILEKLGYARSQKNALYDALIKGGQRISREGLGKEGLVNDLIMDTSTSYDKPEKIREAAELMQVQQDLKLEGIDRSKDNRVPQQKLAEYYQSKDGGGYSKEVSIRMARNLPTTMSEYFSASKATSNQAKLYDATRAATKDGKLFGENVDYMGKINKKKYENISDFLITSPDDGVYNILGRVVVIKDGEKITEVVVQPEVDSKGWFKKSE